MWEIFDYLEENTEGLGERFHLELDHSYDAIERLPGGFEEIKPHIRRKPMNVFSYSIFYRLYPERKQIVILDILHQSRSSDRWPE